MKVSVFGLGYVGAVSAACLARGGHRVIGVDPDQVKVDLINAGQTPIIEKDLEGLIALNVQSGRLRATGDADEAIEETDISLICVGTPSEPTGNIDLTYIERVSAEIGIALARKDGYHIVVGRSTMLPGTLDTRIIPILEEHSGKRAGKDFGVAVNPEFLREGSAIFDFFHPPKIVVGGISAEDRETVARLYRGIQAPVFQAPIRVAEMVKYADNAFHALKITFANELGTICKHLEIDSHDVMNIFCQDTKLNLSPYYLKPGFAFGGSCLPKDLRSLNYLIRHKDLTLPVLGAIMKSNEGHVQRTVELVRAKEKRRVGILGFAFKAETDDLRESPVVALIETLLGQGYEIQIYDRNVNMAKLRGANKRFIEERIPHVAALMRDSMREVIAFAEVLIIGNRSEEFIDVLSLARKGQIVVDLVRIAEEVDTQGNYEGICW